MAEFVVSWIGLLGGGRSIGSSVEASFSQATFSLEGDSYPTSVGALKAELTKVLLPANSAFASNCRTSLNPIWSIDITNLASGTTRPTTA